MNIKELKERTKRLSIIEGCASAVMAGAEIYFITPYAIALGASNFTIGLLNAFSTKMRISGSQLLFRSVTLYPFKGAAAELSNLNEMIVSFVKNHDSKKEGER